VRHCCRSRMRPGLMRPGRRSYGCSGPRPLPAPCFDGMVVRTLFADSLIAEITVIEERRTKVRARDHHGFRPVFGSMRHGCG